MVATILNDNVVNTSESGSDPTVAQRLGSEDTAICVHGLVVMVVVVVRVCVWCVNVLCGRKMRGNQRRGEMIDVRHDADIRIIFSI
jgi:hypothetical protein